MRKSSREPLQVSPVFAERLREIQKKIRMKNGAEKSIREITEEISKSDLLKDIEKRILDGDIEMDIKIKLDRRIA